MSVVEMNGWPLPEGWRSALLNEVCDFLDYLRRPINETERRTRIAGKRKSDLYPYFGANGQVGFIDDYIFDEPLILLAEDGGPFGSSTKPIAYSVKGKCWVNNHAHVLRPKAGVDFDYCLYALSIRPDVGSLVSGNTRPKLNQEVAASIVIPLPSFKEQKRIAAILNEQMAAVEKARAAAEERTRAANAFAASLLRKSFPVAGGGNNETRGWRTASLGSVAHIVSGVTLGRRLTAPAARRVPYLRVANVKDGYLDLSEIKLIEVTETEFEKWKLRKGDLLLTEGGDPDKLGRGTYWKEEIPDCIHQNHIFRVRFHENEVDPEFASLQVGSAYGKEYFLRHAKRTTGIATINQKVLAAFPIALPPIEEQRQIAAALRAHLARASELLTGVAREKEEIERLPTALLHCAFSGQL